ncbi:MAG: CoA transferase [Methylobacteriaceae bacterium]|nr:CoA transferase [Methylobacteriaceae bacterium]
MTAAAVHPPRKPLAGKRVLDCATFIAGPTCATLLGEFGAEVIKVELPVVGCPLRQFGTMTPTGMSLPWLSESRNKKSVTLDLRKPEGSAILKDLVAKSDVLVENFQPGTFERWGLGWEELAARNPALVMVRISAYGQTGPYRDRPGFGRIANAFGGISYLAGYPDRAPVTPGSATLPDYLSGLYGALGALLALRVAETSGAGQVVDIGLYESVFRILDELVPAFAYRGFVRERMGPATVNAVPHSHYPTADGKWIAIACTSDKIFQRLADLVGRPELGGEGRWGTLAKREAERVEVDAFVVDWTSRHRADELLQLCETGQVPCGPLHSIEDIFGDPHYAARQNMTRLAVEGLGEIVVPNVVPRLTVTPGSAETAGPPLGANTDEILSQLLSIDPHRLDELRLRKVI